jgi:glycosyltransferase involved in cell wall biosynthesis
MNPSCNGARDCASPRLSICISTLNRAEFLCATLVKMLPQLTDQCEVIVVDNASSDNTPEVATELARRDDRLRYLRRHDNLGLDGNFDRAIELARGDYCWLMSDDDLLRPGAIAAVLDAVAMDPSVVLVNYEFRDFTMENVLQARVLDIETDRRYGPWELDRMFVELGDFVRYIGALVMRRSLWLSRSRHLYLGSFYHFVGMMYQERLPGPAHVIAEPCVSYRCGNQYTFSEQLMEIVLAKWPSLVTSLPLAELSKLSLPSARPWKHPSELLFWRGSGYYSHTHYQRWIRPQLHSSSERFIPFLCARLPGLLANLIMVAHLSARRSKWRQLDGLKLAMLNASPFYYRGLRPHRRASSPAPSATVT